MSRSFFPDLPGKPRPPDAWAASGMSPDKQPGAGLFGKNLVPPRSSIPSGHGPAGPDKPFPALRVLTIACTGLAALTVIFAALWRSREAESAAARESLDALSAELGRLSNDQSRQHRVFVSTKLENTGKVAALTAETRRLTADLDAIRSQLEASEKQRADLLQRLDEVQRAGRQQSAVLDQERFRSNQLEQNLVITRDDLQQRAADHEQNMRSFQDNLLILRDTVSQREIEVRNITTAAQDEISRTQQAASDIALQAEWLSSQLRTVTCERDRLQEEARRLQAEVQRLEQCLLQERRENEALCQRIHQLECRIRELEARPSQPPTGPSQQPQAPLPPHGPGAGGPPPT